MRTLVIALLLLEGTRSSQPVVAEERLIGLLALPAIFGKTVCEPFEPTTVSLHGEPRGQAVGTLVVLTPWTRQANGGCEGLTLGVRQPPDGPVVALPTMEYAYEEPGAIVLENRAHWYRVRLGKGSAWVEAPAVSGFHDLDRLFNDAMTYLTPAWNGAVFASPAMRPRPAKVPRPRDNEDVPVRVRRTSRDKTGLWFLVDIISGECDGSEPTVLDQGWVPAYGQSAETTIWFHSRGC